MTPKRATSVAGRALKVITAGLLFTGCGPTSQAQPPDPLPAYQTVLQEVDRDRRRLADDLHRASFGRERAGVLDRARWSLYETLRSRILPRWLGTPWDFSGTTQTPGEGSIACGYLVTTVLRDAGLRLDRSRLAQQPSELIIRSLVTREHMRRYCSVPVTKAVAGIESWGKGIYVVGLDCHTGFVVCEDSGVFFVHSSYVDPAVVIREPAHESPILSSSRYRVFGAITADTLLVRRWLEATPIPTQTR